MKCITMTLCFIHQPIPTVSTVSPGSGPYACSCLCRTSCSKTSSNTPPPIKCREQNQPERRLDWAGVGGDVESQLLSTIEDCIASNRLHGPLVLPALNSNRPLCLFYCGWMTPGLRLHGSLHMSHFGAGLPHLDDKAFPINLNYRQLSFYYSSKNFNPHPT